MFPFARGIFEDKVANFWVRLLFLLSSLSKAPAVFLRRSTPLVMELTAFSSFIFSWCCCRGFFQCATNVVVKWRLLVPLSYLPPLALGLTALALLPSSFYVLHLAHVLPSGAFGGREERGGRAGEIVGKLVEHASLSFFLCAFQVHESAFLPPPLPIHILLSPFLPFFTPLRGSDHPHSSLLGFPLVLCAGPKTTEAILLPLLGSMMALAAPSNVLSREQIRWAVLNQTVGMFRSVLSDRFSPRQRVSFGGRADAFGVGFETACGRF